jgi:subtilisin-like proprotein convertase family protein
VIRHRGDVRRAFLVAAMAAAVSCTLVRNARADTQVASIAVPLTGTQGIAAPYPSRMVVTARSGLQTTGPVGIMLHSVSHPCPEDLAILLVRNNTEKFLVLSNAGGCRPLQGTTLNFLPGSGPLPDGQSTTTPFSFFDTVGPSNYGTPPVFPAPAPPGPYSNGLPNGLVSGTWDLYVIDTRPDARGVIAGGWSLFYDSRIVKQSSQVGVALPGTGTVGVAAAYPVTFDLTAVPAGLPVSRVRVAVTLSHTFPDDIVLGLQSPQGTTVLLMGNVGGDIDILPGTVLTFSDFGVPMPDAGPVVTQTYRPTTFNGPGLLAPAPFPPYASTLAAFNGEDIRGTWKLWAIDDAGGDGGRLASATLTVDNDVPPNFDLISPPATSTQPFVRLRGLNVGALSPHSVDWSVTNGGTFYAGGPMLPDPDTPNGFVADIPVKKGVNQIRMVATNTSGLTLPVTHTVTVDEFTYSFAEGATGAFFDMDLTLANTTGTTAPIAVDLLPEGGAPIPITGTIAANSPFQFAVDGIVSGAVSSVVHSTSAVPLAAERTMSWDATGYGGHGGSAVAPDRRWLFAEGSQGFFDTFMLLANDNASDASVTLKFLLEGGNVVSVPVTVTARTRRTIFAGNIPQLVNRSFSLDIDSTLPIIAERAMYLPGPRTFEGGHESAGVNTPSRVWFLAEGATGSFFDCFILLGNPNARNAIATVTFLLPSGATIVRPVTIPANSRLTINVETVDPALANADVSTTIVSDIGIVAERAMYWPDISQGWREAHNSFGVTESALHWGLADGRIGGPRTYRTFVLLANPNPNPAEVDVRFLKAGGTVTRSFVLAPFSRRNIFVNSDVPELGDGPFSVDVQVRNFQPIAVEKALYWDSGGEVFAGGTNVTATRLPPP